MNKEFIYYVVFNDSVLFYSTDKAVALHKLKTYRKHGLPAKICQSELAQTKSICNLYK